MRFYCLERQLSLSHLDVFNSPAMLQPMGA